MPAPLKTEAIVLRSIRYGEADRILHLYTPHRGRVGAIAKGVRRPRSRFGGRLEPFFRLSLQLHEGRGELFTVTAAHTLEAHAQLRTSAGALDSAARACDAVSRLFETTEPHPAVFNLLCRQLALLDELAAGTDRGGGDGDDRLAREQANGGDPAPEGGDDAPASARGPAALRALALAFRLKLLLAAGLAPALGACVCCGEHEHLVGFSGLAGGVVCGSCQTSSFAIDEEAHAFMSGALERSLAQVPAAGQRALGQVERAIATTLEHHAHVRLMPATAA